MDPEPRADTATRWARGHPLWDLEVREAVPHAGLVDTEDGEVLRLDVRDVGLVRDRERAALEVVEASGVDGGDGRARARVVAVLDVASGVGREERGGALVARDLRRDGLAGGELEDVALVRRVVEVPVEPPLVEGVFLEGGHGPVVVRERLHRHVESPH